MGHQAYIAKPLPDEILYSVLARTQSLALYDSPGQLSLDFFGQKNVPATVDLPSRLRFFHSVIKDTLNLSEHDVLRLTLWDYYYCFLTSAKREKALRLIMDGNAYTLYNMVGINPSAMETNRGLKYCPECVKIDREKYNAIYWHRAHQIPEILGCPHHHVRLFTYHANACELKRSFYIDANAVSDQLTGSMITMDTISIGLSLIMAQILFKEFKFDINEVNYQNIISSTSLAKGSSIASAQLVKSFENFYGKEFLNELVPVISNNWITDLVRRPQRYFHPLRHVLMYHFLSHGLIPKKEPHELEKGPWPCLNKASDHFGETVVIEMTHHVDQKSKRLVYRLTCQCGMVYTRSYSASGHANIRIITWGNIWFEKLRQQLVLKKSFRSIGKALGTDAKTISKYASEADFSESEDSNLKVVRAKRKAWEKALSKFRENKIVQARKHNPALYIWLYRNDPDWLREINNNNSSSTSNPELRLDWESLDIEVADLIVKTVEKLKQENYRGKITKSLISKIIHAQHYLLGKNAKNLPLSIDKLNLNIESKDQFHSRRILEAINDLKSISQLKGWKVMRKAGLGNKVSTKAIQILNDELKYG